MPEPIDTPLILSKSAFAVRRRVSVSAVCKWVERKRIFGEALTPDGRIVVELAERQLGVTLDVVRSEGKRASAAGADHAADEPVSVREEILRVELEQKRRRLAAEKGVYVRSDQVRAARGRVLSQMIAAIESGFIRELPAELGLDREREQQLGRSWRRFRERQADALLAEAAGLPEFVTDAA